MDTLKEYAAHRGWTRALLQQCQRQFRSNFRRGGGLEVPRDLRSLWADGIVYFTPEFGLEFNTAAMAALGYRQEIRHRSWRGQVGLVLPMLDRVRLAVCAHLTETYGPGWPLLITPESEQEASAMSADPFACQLGHLDLLLHRSRTLAWEDRWIPLIREARGLRNELALYRPVCFADFSRFHELAGALLDE